MKWFYKKYKSALIIIMLMVMGTITAFAEENLTSEEQQIVAKLKDKPLNGFFGFTFSNAVPQGEFFDSLKNSAQGFSLYGGYDMDPIPVVFGAELDFMFFGGEERIFRYGPGNWAVYRDTVTTSSSMIPLNVFARLQPNISNFVFPYVEAIAGINFLSVTADYKGYYGDKDTKDRFSVAFNYGFGAGVMVKLVDFITLPNSYSQMLLDVKMKYIKGSRADYATVKIKNDSSAEFSDFETQTDMVMFLIGLTFRF
jgi:hypothetical protein